MTSADMYGYWANGQWYPWYPDGTGGGFTTSAPAIAAAAEPMPTGWKCTDCGTVSAPWMATHKCPGAGQLAPAPDPQFIYKGPCTCSTAAECSCGTSQDGNS